MKVTVDMGYGITVEITESDDKMALFKAINLTGNWCHECQAVKDGFRYITNKTDDDILYIKRVCNCGAVSTLGTYRGDKGHFWKKFEKYEKTENGKSEPQKQTTGNEPPPPTDEDLGF